MKILITIRLALKQAYTPLSQKDGQVIDDRNKLTIFSRLWHYLQYISLGLASMVALLSMVFIVSEFRMSIRKSDTRGSTPFEPRSSEHSFDLISFVKQTPHCSERLIALGIYSMGQLEFLY